MSELLIDKEKILPGLTRIITNPDVFQSRTGLVESLTEMEKDALLGIVVRAIEKKSLSPIYESFLPRRGIEKPVDAVLLTVREQIRGIVDELRKGYSTGIIERKAQVDKVRYDAFYVHYQDGTCIRRENLARDPFVRAYNNNGYHVIDVSERPQQIDTCAMAERMAKILESVSSERDSKTHFQYNDEEEDFPNTARASEVVVAAFTHPEAQTKGFGQLLMSNRYREARLALLERCTIGMSSPEMLIRVNPFKTGGKGYPLAMMSYFDISQGDTRRFYMNTPDEIDFCEKRTAESQINF